MQIPAHFQPAFRPQADPDAVIRVGSARFTILTERVIRLEYDPDGRFQNKPTQLFWYREQSVPSFTTEEVDGRLHIRTDHLHLVYHPGQSFAAETLSITLQADNITWRYGDEDARNLGGTARTLDGVSGSTPLEPGLLSRSGWAVVDDAHRLVFNDQGWLEPRSGPEIDLYFFGYGRDYKTCLQDYSRLTGAVPLLPRWVLGNWWSRYWAYTDQELIDLMEAFRAHEIPLSVCIVDMDWHLTDVGDFNGWTGYTWNRDLFPDPAAFLERLHDMGLKTALNLHPALGVRPYEDAYPEMARRLGKDPAEEQPIPFDIADPAFAAAYFELLHHPLEEMGVDFWWIDWQQGHQSGLPGLDPLWWLNHLHFLDAGREEQKRPFIFSRWGGLGNHRTPIGFSGDTWVDWETLAFQPAFTATAANVGYGWWSHDIGGHMFGIEDAELFTRWVQFGVFSPILRLHSTKNPFHERRPWGYDADTFHQTRKAMQLRHALIPYLYTQSWRNHREHIPPIRPMYHDYPEEEAAYACPGQYTFGSELIAAPYVEPADADTRLSRQVIWLPPGDWYHFFNGEYLAGGGWYAQYGALDDIPVFARAGAIVPLGPMVDWGGLENPAELDLHLFAGADGDFTLYEDDGTSQAYKADRYSLTAFRQVWRDREMEISVTAVTDHHHLLPDVRAIRLHVHGIRYPVNVDVLLDGEPVSCLLQVDGRTETVHLSPLKLPKTSTLTATIRTDEASLLARRDRTDEKVKAMLQAFKLDTQAKMGIWQQMVEWKADPALLQNFRPVLTPSQARALLEVTQQAGIHHVRHTSQPDLLVLWNNREQEMVKYRLNEYDRRRFWIQERFQTVGGVVPRFLALTPVHQWQVEVDYAGGTAVTTIAGAA